MTLTIATARLLEPAPGLLVFYDGRVTGRRAYAAEPNWIDDGAYGLGIAAFAIIDSTDALIYDTHMSIAHAQWMRDTLTSRGVRTMRVVLSHSHLDHVAGNAVFQDCEIIAHRLTALAMAEKRAHIEDGSYDGPPAIKPLVMPTSLFEGTHELMVGRRRIELHHMDIHSRDGVVLVLPDDGLLLAGDTLEDTITYVAEPERLEIHLGDLARLAALGARRILPNHGDRDRLAAGGYDPSLITATERYVRRLIDASQRPAGSDEPLLTFVAPELAAGSITYYAPYEAVHARNLAVVRSSRQPRAG